MNTKSKNTRTAYFRWAPGTKKKYKVSAQVAASEFYRIEELWGQIDLYRVVLEAQPDDAPLHSEFDWTPRPDAFQLRVGHATDMWMDLREVGDCLLKP